MLSSLAYVLANLYYTKPHLLLILCPLGWSCNCLYDVSGRGLQLYAANVQVVSKMQAEVPKVIYKPENFNLVELVDPITYTTYGESSWKFLDERAVRTTQWVRDLLGIPITVNNWHKGGYRRWSGLRINDPRCDVYSERSQHTAGRGFDAVCSLPAQEVRDRIAAEWPKTGLGWPITLESRVSWLHIDVRTNERIVNFF